MTVEVLFVASVSPIVRDGEAARRLYGGALGVTFEGGEGDYSFTERLDGVKHFGLWPLRAAAEACFGTATWPANLPVPQVSIEFEVDDVAAAADELHDQGYRLLHEARTEPWTQTTARLLSADGVLIAVCHTPWLRAARSRFAAGDAFRSAVEAVHVMIASPLVSVRWDQPSALDGMTVGELAAHVVRALTTVVAYAARPAPTGEPISPAAYYLAVLGEPSDLRSDPNRGVRERARHDAQGGHQQLVRRWEEARTAVTELLANEPPDRLIAVAGDLVLTLDDYLRTRIVELVVHADDLAVSLDLEFLPPLDAARIAEHVLLDLARGRHGDTAVLRALARRERAPAQILQVL